MTPGSPAVDRPPPEAALIRLVRQAAKIPVAAAAKRAGISTARWTQVEQGYETRAGERRPATAPPDTLAYMAAAIGLPPERLESEGQRPDAAAVLREMRGHGAVQPVPPAGEYPDDDPVLRYIRNLPGLSSAERESLEYVARSPRLDAATRWGLVALTIGTWQQQDARENRSA